MPAQARLRWSPDAVPVHNFVPIEIGSARLWQLAEFIAWTSCALIFVHTLALNCLSAELQWPEILLNTLTPLAIGSASSVSPIRWQSA